MSTKHTSLKTVANIHAGYPFRGKIPETPGSDICAIQMKHITENRTINWQQCTPTTLTGKRQPQWLQPGHIIVAARGNHHYAVLIPEAIRQINPRFIAAPHFFVLAVKKQNILPQYLAWLLNQSHLQDYFTQNAEGSVTKSIRRQIVEEASIPLPNKQEQQKIVNLITTVQKEQALLAQLHNNSQQIMQGIANQIYKGNRLTASSRRKP